MEQTGDITYYSGPMALLTLAEFALTIVCCCMPVVPKFCTTVGNQVFSTSQRAKSMRTALKASSLGQQISTPKSPQKDRRIPIDPYDPENQLQSQYEELEEYNSSQIGEQRPSSAAPGNTTQVPESPLGKVEPCYDDKRIVRTVHIATERHPEDLHSKATPTYDW